MADRDITIPMGPDRTGEIDLPPIDFGDAGAQSEQADLRAPINDPAPIPQATYGNEYTNKEVEYAGFNDRYEEALRIVKLHEEGRDSELPYEKMELTTVVAEANRICVLKDGPESFSFTLTCMSLGDVALAGLPGEPFVEIGLDIEKASPFAETIVCCLTNGGDSYFPASSAYDEGGYEARTSQLRKGGDKIIVDGMKKVLTELKNK